MNDTSFEHNTRPNEIELRRMKNSFDSKGGSAENKTKEWIEKFGGIDAQAILWYQEELRKLPLKLADETLSVTEEIAIPKTAVLVKEVLPIDYTTAWIWTAVTVLDGFNVWINHVIGNDNLAIMGAAGGALAATLAIRKFLGTELKNKAVSQITES